MTAPIVLLGADGESTRIVYNRLVRTFGAFPAIIEKSVSQRTLLKNRVRKLGLISVASQVAFLVAVRPVLAHLARKRLDEIKRENDFDTSPIPEAFLSNVASVNAAETIALLKNIGPKVVVVSGTRIISRKTLESTSATFINCHAGITPAYRGAHGGYWALYQRDPDRCGVTVHKVDPGIDTGDIIGQSLINPTPDDSFVTYPYLQLAAALPILQSSVAHALEGTLSAWRGGGDSAVWYHPGIGQYLAAALRGVR